MQCCVTTTQLPAITTFNCKDAILCSQISRFGNAKWVSLTPGWACIPCGSTCIQCRPCSGATVSWVRLLSRSVVPLEASTRSTLSSVLPLPYWPKRDTSIMFSVREVVRIWGPELNLPGKVAKAAPPPRLSPFWLDGMLSLLHIHLCSSPQRHLNYFLTVGLS